MTRLGAMVRGFNQGFGRGVAGFAGGAQAEQAGYDAAMQRETRLAQAVAQIKAQEANAERDTALAAETRLKTERLGSRPDIFEEQAALSAGVDLPTLRAVRRSVATGQAPQIELMGPATPEGGALMGDLNLSPEVKSRIGQALMRLVPLQTNTGDIKPDDWAQAMGRFADQDLQAKAVSGDMPQGQLSRALSVLRASPIFKIPEGFTGDQFSGDIPTAAPVNQGRAAYVGAQTRQAQSAAAENFAQAGAANALRDQRVAMAAQGPARGRAPSAYRWTTDANGQPALEFIPGGPADPNLKPQRPLSGTMANGIMENNRNLRRAEYALALAEGKNVGGAQGDPEATGLKGYLPNQLLNRIDPKGVETRAAIADLGSLVIHDRSGAAVTAAEFPRLAPFIPNEKDDSDAVKKKLRQFVKVYSEIVREQVDFLRGSGFNVPEDALLKTNPSGAAPAAGAGGFKYIGRE